MNTFLPLPQPPPLFTLKDYVCSFCPHCFYLSSLNLSIPFIHVALHSQGGDIVSVNNPNNAKDYGIENFVKSKSPKLPAVWTDPLWSVPVA